MASNISRTVEKIHAGAPPKLSGALLSANDAKRLLADSPGLAEQRARDILEQKPNNRTALLLLGAALRRQGRTEAAKTVLKSLIESRPHYAMAQVELGLALADLGEFSDSFAAFLQAVDFDPGFAGAWHELGRSLALLGVDGGKIRTADEALPRHKLQLGEAEAAFQLGHLDVAECLLSELLEVCPDDLDAMTLLADTLLRAGHYADTEALLVRCVAAAPNRVATRFRLATVLLNNLDFQEALRQADELLRRVHGDTLFHYLKAVLLARMDAFDQAVLEYEAVLTSDPHRAGVWIGYAHALKVLGRDRECVAAYKKAIELVPSFGELYRQLASVKTFRFESAMVDALRLQLSRPHQLGVDLAHLHFALAKALEDAGQYEEAFDNYMRSNALQRKHLEYSARTNSENVQRTKALFTPMLPRVQSAAGCDARCPIFIVGMPRAGSTLIEQILCSHSAIEALGELRLFGYVAEKVGHLNSLDSPSLRLLADEYLQLVDPRRKLGRPFFTDKMPGNFVHAGLICMMFPNAKIIDARRHPLDCCLSCFTNFFPLGQPFASDLTELGRYYADYVERMAHFDEVFPGRIHRVFYEQLVENPEREVRRLLEYMGLPFEDTCLRFYETDRNVKTMSAEQVRMPMYRHGVGRWHKFEAWLAPLKTALGNVLEAYPAVPKFGHAGGGPQ